jgi:hypothetical protein
VTVLPVNGESWNGSKGDKDAPDDVMRHVRGE